MPEDEKPIASEPVGSTPPEASAAEQEENDAGDFITRHVLEKDSVFFEG